MKRVLFFIFLIAFSLQINAQRKLGSGSGFNIGNDSIGSGAKETQVKIEGKTKYTDYKLISLKYDTTYVDTTLTMRKDFKFNYIRKDDFELLPFHNLGQTFSKLGYDFNNNSLFPKIGFSAKQYNYKTLNDIYYFFVPTPTTELMYKTAMEQGQMLDAFFTFNTSRQFNLSIAYKGLRSLGKYRNSLSSHGNFRTTFNYISKKKLYNIRGHFYSYDFLNYENGGLTAESIDYFELNDPNYSDRARLETNYTDAENMFEGKRYYLEQNITLFSKKDNAEKNILNQKRISVLDSLQIQIRALKADSLKLAETAVKIVDSTKLQDTLNIKPIDTLVIDTFPIKDSINVKTIDTLTIDSLKIKDTVLVKTIDTLAIESVNVKDKFPAKKSDSLNVKPKKDKAVKKEAILSKSDSLKVSINFKLDSLRRKELNPNIQLDSIEKAKIDELGTFKLFVGNNFMYETQHYRFKQTSVNEIFGSSFNTSISDHTAYKKMNAGAFIGINSKTTGKLRAKVNYFDYNYHYGSILYLDNGTIPDKFKGNAISVGADWSTKYGKLKLDADASSILSGDLEGNVIKASVAFEKDSVYSFKGFAELTSKTPDLNKVHFQSDYKTYNWFNDFKNEEIKSVGAKFTFNKYGSLGASYNIVDNYTYFDETATSVQAEETLNYLRAKLHFKYSYWKLTLENTVLYQMVEKGEEFFRVPEVLARSSFYFSDNVFKGDPMYLQTGVTVKYFTPYQMNSYNPLLSEYVLQNDIEIGGYPILDFFINAQIQRTRLYLKVENFSASFTGREYYSAPNYPYRDLMVRFGLVWNFFI